MSSTETRVVPSRVLGEVSVPNDSAISFPSGLLGFPEAKSFALVSTSREGFYWLQSLEHDTLTFLLVDPFIHLPDFSIDLPDEEMGILGTEADNIVVLGIVTLPANAEASLTVNLQGPLVINAKRGVGRQIVVDQPGFTVRHPLNITAALLAS